MPRRADRAADERLLGILADKAAGKTWWEIGLRAGQSAGGARQAYLRVLEADLAESGEPADVVRAGYA
ncbi:MAG: hypothetical protein AAGF30_00440 [Pseudomonadota bacterium]